MRFNDSNSKTFWENSTAIPRPFLGDDIDTVLSSMNHDRIRAEIFSISDSDLGSKTAFDNITNNEIERLSDIKVSKADVEILPDAGVVHIKINIEAPLDVDYIKLSTRASRFSDEHNIKVCSDRQEHYFSIVRRFNERPMEAAIADAESDASTLNALIHQHNQAIRGHRERFLSLVNGWLQERRSGNKDIAKIEKDLKDRLSSLFR